MRSTNHMALKEWAMVVQALQEGRQILLLRKGGIAEAGGQFRIQHTEFFLYPTFLHQDKEYIRPEFYPTFDEIQKGEAFGRVRMASYAVVEEVIQATDLALLQKLEPYHIWTPAYIDLRYRYKPENPLSVMLLRTYTLPQVMEFEETRAYKGCKSWVPLDFEIATAGVTPVLTDRDFHEKARAIRETLRVS